MRIGNIDSQANMCNHTLLWLTKSEEQRQLNELEKMLKRLLTERLEAIEALKETKWRQRTKRQWVQQGDKNTRYFHAMATCQQRINSITSLMVEGNEVNRHAAKAKALFDYFCSIIGTPNTETLHFDLHSLFHDTVLSQQEADSLCLPWSEQDIRTAISTWKSNRSPGPDGFSGEFYNTFMDIMLPDLKEVHLHVNAAPSTTLFPLNDSYIVLVPKKEGLLAPQDYRPISLVNAIQKLYSKIAAAKIKPLLDKLLSCTQTGFLKSRSILHGFYYAQQTLQTASRQKSKIAVFKADIFKAFDTVDWDFLLSSLQARGFPNSSIQCIKHNILKGTSRVLLNSVAGKKIVLRRGVRQGDPLSPYLFIIAMDFLSKWVQKLVNLDYIAPPFPQCRVCLLYADRGGTTACASLGPGTGF